MGTLLLIIVLFILGFILCIIAASSFDYDAFGWMGLILIVLSFGILIYGCFNGFINHKPTSGMHQGVITAVDLEGTYFRRYEVYLKSGGYTSTYEGLQSDETTYCLYENETELVNKLNNAIGKTVKITYGHDGGKIAWNSCGTYHIKDVEIVEEDNKKE